MTRTLDGSSPRAMTSRNTSPVNISAGPLAVGRLGSICTAISSVSMPVTLPRPDRAVVTEGGASARVGADVGDAPPASAGRGERHLDVPDLSAAEVHRRELAG